jgi:hypothetical protein
MSDNSVSRTRKTLYFRFDSAIVEMFDVLSLNRNVPQEQLLADLICDAYDDYLANLAMMEELKAKKIRLLAQIEDIDDQLKSL